MTQSDPIAFVFAQLATLQKMRDQNAGCLNSLIAELNQALPKITAPDVTTKAMAEQSALDRPSPISSVKLIWQNLKRHYVMARQALHAVKKDQEILLFGVELNRLDLRVSRDLGTLVQAHMALGLSSVAGWFDTPAARLGFYPNKELSHAGLQSDITTPLLSPWAIMIIGLMQLYRTNPFTMIRTFATGLRTLGYAYPSLPRRIVSLVALSLFITGALYLFHQTKGVRFLTLTSNSLFLEVLRSIILANPRNHVVEIQHGISNPISDPYLRSFGPALERIKGGRFDVHPLLPNPFCHAATDSPRFRFTDQPSNTGIFKALHRLGANGTAPLDHLFHHSSQVVERIWHHAAPFCQDGKLIFAILGGTDLEDDYYLGDAFKVEIALVEQVRRRFQAQGIDVQYLYLPHPANRSLTQLRFADGQNIVISERSQISYFFADYALSLYSSSIFEATAFGVRTFAPLPEHIDLFYPDMIRQLCIPNQLTYTGLVKALDRFCANATTDNIKHRAKIAYRVNLALSAAVSPLEENGI